MAIRNFNSALFRFAMAAAVAAPLVRAEDLKLYWGIHTIDTSREAGGYSRPKFDKDDNLKVAYRGHYDIQYAEYLGNRNWKVALADTGTGAAAKVELAIDPSQNPHILYQSAEYASVYYAKKEGGSWKHRLIDKPGIQNVDFYQISMAPDSKGGIHMAYSKAKDGWATMFYNYLDKDGNMGDSGFVYPELSGKWNTMVMDKDDKPVIAFFRNHQEELIVAWTENGTWKNQTVVGDTSHKVVGFHASITRESDSTYRLIYQDKDKHELWTATGSLGGTWTHEKIADLDGFSYFNSSNAVAIGKGGMPMVAYSNVKSSDGLAIEASRLMFAYRESGEWKKVVVDSVGITGEFATLAVNSEGIPAISYFARTDYFMKVAIGSLTPVSLRRPLARNRTHNALRSAAPSVDANGRREAARPAGYANRSFPQSTIRFVRPADMD